MRVRKKSVYNVLGAVRSYRINRMNVTAKRRREDEADARLLTLHLLLQTMKGSRLSVERRDGSMVEGTLDKADEKMKCAQRIRHSHRSCLIVRTPEHC